MMTEEQFIQMLLEDFLDYYAHKTGEWDDPTGDLAVELAEKTPTIIERR